MEMMTPEQLMRYWNMCKAYDHADQAHRDAALSLMSEGERKYFLEKYSLYRLLTDERRFNAVCQAMASQMYEELNEGAKKH